MCFALFAMYITATPLNSITLCCLNRWHCVLCNRKWNFVSYVGELWTGIFLAWSRRSDPVLSRWRPCFDSRLVRVGFVAHQPALGEVFLPSLWFPLSVSFHHCSILIHSSTTHAVKCFSPSTPVFPCQYHSTIAPYSSIHLPPTLYNIFLPALQFPLSVSFHHCSIPIHPSTTHAP